MIDACIQGLQIVFSLEGMLYCFIGATVGYIFGFLPGVGAGVAETLLIPLTYGMKPDMAMVMLAGILGGVTFGGSVASILINTPGTGANAATALDGYALSQQGRAGEALGASAASSFLGHFFGIGVLLAIIPVMTKLVLAFGPPEWFALGIGGICLIAIVSGRSLLNGLISGCIGLLLGVHGVNPVVGSLRYVFGQVWLWQGIPLIAFIVGMMALSEMMRLFKEEGNISRSGSIEVKGVFTGVKEAVKRLPLIMYCGIQGIIIGAIPGVGGNVSSWIALAQAKSVSKHPETFGKGNIEGVIGPESANDATTGGALMPLVSLGIPGSPSTAILLGAFIMHGLQPGRILLTEQLHVVTALSFAHLFGAFIACSIGLWAAKFLARITTISTEVLVPIMSVFCFIGVFASQMRISDVGLAIGFALFGYVMKKCDIPSVPAILGLILGPLIERSYQVAMQISGGSFAIFYTRPVVWFFAAGLPGLLFGFMKIGTLKRKKVAQG
jgi:putative tricarboxylic transport membrane protein